MKKSTTITFLIVLILIGVLAAVALSYAWYNAEVKTGTIYEIPATGFLVIEFDPEETVSGGVLKPAVAMPDAVLLGRYTHPLILYNPSDVKPSYVQEVATVVTYRATLRLYDYGIPTTGEHEVQFNYGAKVIHPEYGELSIRLNDDIVMDVTITVEDINVPAREFLKIQNNFRTMVNGSAVIYVQVDAYLAQVDDLSDLFIRDCDVILTLMATVVEP